MVIYSVKNKFVNAFVIGASILLILTMITNEEDKPNKFYRYLSAVIIGGLIGLAVYTKYIGKW